MKVVIKYFIFLCLFCNIQLFSRVRISFPKNKIYFSKKVLDSGVSRAKKQLSNAYYYCKKRLLDELSLVDFEKLSIAQRVKVQTSFHQAYGQDEEKEYKTIFEELDIIQKHLDEKIVQIYFVCFESVIENLSFVYRLMNGWNDLRICFDGCEFLNQNVLAKLQSDSKCFEINFQDSCSLIDDLFALNDKLIAKKVKIPQTEKFLTKLKCPKIPFKFGFLEKAREEKFPVPLDYLSVVFESFTF